MNPQEKRRTLLKSGYFVGGFLLLPVVPMVALAILEGPATGTPAGGFGANMRLVYLMILGGPLIALGLIVLAITTGIWLFSGRSTKD